MVANQTEKCSEGDIMKSYFQKIFSKIIISATIIFLINILSGCQYKNNNQTKSANSLISKVESSSETTPDYLTPNRFQLTEKVIVKFVEAKGYRAVGMSTKALERDTGVDYGIAIYDPNGDNHPAYIDHVSNAELVKLSGIKNGDWAAGDGARCFIVSDMNVQWNQIAALCD